MEAPDTEGVRRCLRRSLRTPVTERDLARLVAWSTELRAIHQRLREALQQVRAARDTGRHLAVIGGDLLLFCHGFCSALADHHRAEDRELFPDIAAAYPELRGTLRRLEQDHQMIAGLIADLQAASADSATVDELDRHLDGIAAIMESHFRYEERELLGVLDSPDTEPSRAPTTD